MIYFKIATIAIAAVGLLIYTLLFDRKYFFGLLIAEVICTGLLSFYTFYYIGSYSSGDNETLLNTNLHNEGGGNYSLHIDVKWKRKPEIFGLDGNDDMLVVRYNPKLIEVVSADRNYNVEDDGKTAVKLSKDYKYSKIAKYEKEIYFNIKDGENTRTKVNFKEIKPGGMVKVFFLHDYKLPLESTVYWEKDDLVELK